MIKNLFHKYREFIVYVVVGLCTTCVALAVYYFCVFTFLDPKDALQLQIANVASWVCGVLFAYVTNRKFVFQSRSEEIAKEFTSFVSARLATLLLDMAIMFVGVTLLGLNDKIIKLIVQVLVTIANFAFSKLWVFKSKDKEQGYDRHQ